MLALTDPLVVLSKFPCEWPGEAAPATVEYALTQDDIDTGVVLSAATVGGESPTAIESETPEPQDPVTDDLIVVTLLEPVTAIEVEKSGALADQAAEGEKTVDYKFAASNTGNVTLADVGSRMRCQASPTLSLVHGQPMPALHRPVLGAVGGDYSAHESL